MYLLITSHSHLELIPTKNINKSENNTLSQFVNAVLGLSEWPMSDVTN